MPEHLDRLVGNPKPLQRAHDEGARGKLVLETGMIPGAGLGHDPRAVLIDNGRQLVGPIGGQTGLHQEFHAANVLDPVAILDPNPKAFAGRTELSGQIRGIFDDGKLGWVLRKFFHGNFPC